MKMVGNLEKEFEGLVKNVLVRAKEELEKLNEEDFPYDFNSNAIHEIVDEEVDDFVCGFSRQDCLAWIDFCGNEEHVDRGIIDTSSIDRILITTAYECIRMKLFEDDLINDLQEYELTAEKRDEFIRRINERIGDEEYKVGEDNETQIFIETEFDIEANDFKEPYFAGEQIVELGGGDIKILNEAFDMEKINRNAIVLEKKRQGLYRIYLMDKDKNVDIRKFFDKKHFDSKDELLDVLIRMSNELFMNNAKKHVEKEG